METFLDEPDLITHYLALDPSVWWNAGEIVESAPSHIALFDSKPRTLYFASSPEPSTSVGTAKIDATLRAARPRGLRWTYAPRPDLTHVSIFRATKPGALVDAFR